MKKLLLFFLAFTFLNVGAQTILFDQSSITASGSNNSPSQKFTDFSNNVMETTDNFTIPNGEIWALDSVEFGGVYGNTNGQTSQIEVNIYAKNTITGFPSTLIANDVINIPLNTNAEIMVSLTTPVVLNSGDYFVSFLVVMPNNPNGQFFINALPLPTSDTDAVYFRDPGNLLSLGYTSWTKLDHNQTAISAYKNLDFKLIGSKTGSTIASVRYVNHAASGNNDGSSWTDAYTDLKNALDMSVIGDTLLVAQGTYTPSTSDRTISFELKQDVKMYGGFDGTETSISQRDWVANPTILSGDLNGDDNANLVLTEPTRLDNSYNVVRIIGDETLIDGFTIQDGNADNTSNNDYNRGAAIFKLSSVAGDLEVKNCKIIKNVANHSAGLWLEYTSATTPNVTIDNCIFMDNNARYGASFSMSLYAGTGDFTVSNCLMANNETVDNSFGPGFSGSAGIIDSRAGSTLNANMFNCTVVDNVESGTNSTVPVKSVVVVRRYDGILNCIAANNVFYNNVGAAATFAAMNSTNCPTSTTLINNIRTDFSTIFCGATATGEFYNAPLLDGNYKPTSSSPVLDAGDNAYVFTSKDYYGTNRILNSTVDIGAYEFDITSGVKDIVKNKLSLYPNPTTSQLTIANIQSQVVSVRILDVTGKVVKTEVPTNNTIDVSNLINGVYFIQVQTKEGMHHSKFIKE